MLPLDIFHQDSATPWVIGKCWAFPCQHKQHDWISSWKQISHAKTEFFLEPDSKKNLVNQHDTFSINPTWNCMTAINVGLLFPGMSFILEQVRLWLEYNNDAKITVITENIKDNCFLIHWIPKTIGFSFIEFNFSLAQNKSSPLSGYCF